MSCQPYSVVEESEFIQLIRLLNPTAQLISNKTVKEDLLAAYHRKVSEIKEKLKNVPGKISITLDIWTSKNVLAFLVIRAHWINEEWQYRTQQLDFAPINGDHGGANQCRIFLACIDRFELPMAKILAYTIDNASSNDKFLDLLKLHGVQIGTPVDVETGHIRCLAHILNLTVQDILRVLSVSVNPNVDEDDVMVRCSFLLLRTR